MTTWTTIPAPVGTSSIVSFTGGEPYGLLLALTQSTSSVTAGGDIWTRITNPTGTIWTSVATAT